MGFPASQVFPQPPQLAAFVKSTQPPSHRLYPPLQLNAQAPPRHAGIACATAVVHERPQAPQFLGSVPLSTHIVPHWVAAFAGQLATHPWPPSAGAHTGVEPLQTLPHAPQDVELAGSTQPPSQAMVPNEQPLSGSSDASTPTSDVRPVSAPPSVAGGCSSPAMLASQSPAQVTDRYEFSPLMIPQAPSTPTIAAAPTIPPSQRTSVMLRETHWGRKRD